MKIIDARKDKNIAIRAMIKAEVDSGMPEVLYLPRLLALQEALKKGIKK